MPKTLFRSRDLEPVIDVLETDILAPIAPALAIVHYMSLPLGGTYALEMHLQAEATGAISATARTVSLRLRTSKWISMLLNPHYHRVGTTGTMVVQTVLAGGADIGVSLTAAIPRARLIAQGLLTVSAACELTVDATINAEQVVNIKAGSFVRATYQRPAA